MASQIEDGTLGVILRAFACSASDQVANELSERLNTARYGYALVDANYAVFGGQHEWFDNFRSAVDNGIKMIALISSQLTAPLDAEKEEKPFPGIALLGELVYLWDRDSKGRGSAADTLIPVILDCDLGGLARHHPNGEEYEILQDAVVPMIERLDPIHISARRFVDDPLSKLAVAKSITWVRRALYTDLFVFPCGVVRHDRFYR